MLANFIDANGVQECAGITAQQFTHAQNQYLLPPPAGHYRGAALWDQQTILKHAATLRHIEPAPGLVPNYSVPVIPGLITNGIGETLQTTEPESEWHGLTELPQGMAARYLDATVSFLSKCESKGLIGSNKEPGTLLRMYRRADLDALRDLPVYKLRVRRGYRAGILNTMVQAKKDNSKIDETISQGEAAKLLNIEPGVLALTRKDGSGPAWVDVSGQARYRVADVEKFKLTMDRAKLPRLVAQVIYKEPAAPVTIASKPAALSEFTLSSADVIARLNTTSVTLKNWRQTGHGPAWIKIDGEHTVAFRYSESGIAAFLDSPDGLRFRARQETVRKQAADNPEWAADRVRKMRAGLKANQKTIKATTKPPAMPKRTPAKQDRNAVSGAGKNLRH